MMRYEEIAKRLGLDPEEDKKAAELLGGLVEEADITRLKALLCGACVIVFGAGPSLKNDLGRVRAAGLDRSCVLIAAGGAIKALLDAGVVPQIHVTDLDGDEQATFEANRRGCITVVLAHGDNVELIMQQVPKLKGVIGTTQVAPFGRLLNLGGFSDGDRAAYLAHHFGAKMIALAGMDFGRKIGEYSGSMDPKSTIKKLAIGKRMLEELAEKSKSRIVNLTEKGEKLDSIPHISVEELKAAAAHIP
jgi:uncharacterized Rossmann fold enzyme